MFQCREIVLVVQSRLCLVQLSCTRATTLETPGVQGEAERIAATGHGGLDDR